LTSGIQPIIFAESRHRGGSILRCHYPLKWVNFRLAKSQILMIRKKRAILNRGKTAKWSTLSTEKGNCFICGICRKESVQSATKRSRRRVDGIPITSSGRLMEARTHWTISHSFTQIVTDKSIAGNGRLKSRVLHWALERLEPVTVKVVHRVLRGEGGRNAPALPDR